MDMTPADAERIMRRHVKNRDLTGFLEFTVGFFERLGRAVEWKGRAFPFPVFDQFCQTVGADTAYELFGSHERIADDHDFVVITEATTFGGHSELIRDLIRYNPRPIVVACTNIHNREDAVHREVVELALATITLRDALPLRLRTLQYLMANPSAHRVILLCHGHDAVAVAAASGALARKTLYLHHCDHYPALGCHLDGVTHVDLHNIGHARCRLEEGVSDNRYLCLTSTPRGRRRRRRFAHPRLKTATCANEAKLETIAYPIGYADMVHTLLSAGDGVHFHIGNLTAPYIERMRHRLSVRGIDPERFVPVGAAPGLVDILAELDVDLYLPSLPVGGGKAMIDAMAAEIPCLIHESGINRLWGSRDLVYPEALYWGDLTQLEEVICNLGPEEWERQIEFCRVYFSRYHSPALFQAMLADDAALSGTAMPALKKYQPSPRYAEGGRA